MIAVRESSIVKYNDYNNMISMCIYIHNNLKLYDLRKKYPISIIRNKKQF